MFTSKAQWLCHTSAEDGYLINGMPVIAVRDEPILKNKKITYPFSGS